MEDAFKDTEEAGNIKTDPNIQCNTRVPTDKEIGEKNDLKERRRSKRNALKQVCNDYFNHTSLHGLQYISQNRTLCEKLLWIACFFLSFTVSIYLIYQTFRKWKDNPVIVSFSEDFIPISSIPFPAVTICPQLNTKTDVFNLTRITGYMSKYRSYNPKYMDDCKNSAKIPYGLSNETFINLRTHAHMYKCTLPPSYECFQTKRFNSFPFDIEENVYKMTPTEYVRNITWLTLQDITHDIYVQKTRTEDGICLTFNGLRTTDLVYYVGNVTDDRRPTVENWSLETGYLKDTSDTEYPKRVFTADTKGSLEILIGEYVFHHEETKSSENCAVGNAGYKIILHSPDEYPRPSKTHYPIGLSRKGISFMLSPNLIQTSKSLRSYDPNTRNCFFENERLLGYFKIYTQGNCEYECLTNYTLQKCHCVRFFTPRAKHTPVCNEVADIACYQLAGNEFSSGAHSAAIRDFKKACNCLPKCTSLQFSAEIASYDRNQNMLESLSFYFKDNKILSLKRSELYGIIDFLGNFGGLLGLFIGMSALSVFEIIYFFTFRLIGTYFDKRTQV